MEHVEVRNKHGRKGDRPKPLVDTNDLLDNSDDRSVSSRVYINLDFVNVVLSASRVISLVSSHLFCPRLSSNKS